MENKKAVSVRKLAALERKRALGLPIKRPAISALERQAREWKRREEMGKPEDGGQRSEVRGRRTEDGGPKSEVQDEMFQIGLAGPRDSGDRGTGEGFDWKPYQSGQGEGKKKVKNLNTASVARIARKIMAREWAMALGGRSQESSQTSIERKAAEYGKKKEAERERKEKEKQSAREQRPAFEKALRSFGHHLLKSPKHITPEAAEALLEEALSEVGECIKITWQPHGCDIFIEPWEVRRLRLKSGEPFPAVFQAKIDDNLMLNSLQKIEDLKILQKTRNDMILKDILLSFRKSAGKDLPAFEDAVAEGGRIIRSMKTNGGWKISFEPWDEMRRRNVERKGLPPVVTYMIKADKDFEHITCRQ